MAKIGRRTPWRLSGGVALGLILLSGCSNTTQPIFSGLPSQKESTMNTPDPDKTVPTGDQLYAESKANFLTFLDEISALQMTLEPGQWRVGDYGDYPSVCRLKDGRPGYRFVLQRSTTHEGHDINEVADQVEMYLLGKDYDVERQAHNPTMRGVMGWGAGLDGFHGVASMIYFIADDNGSMSIQADSGCFPGDDIELTKIQTNNYASKRPWKDYVAPTDPPEYGQEAPVK